MKILITGSSGFLGSALYEAIKNENFDVVRTDIVGKVDYLGDLSCSRFVETLPEVDVVINCAAVQYVTRNKPIFRFRDFFKRNNVDLVNNLANKYKDVHHFIHIGTTMQYSQNLRGEYDEQTAMCGCGVYSKTKLVAYNLLKEKVVNLSVVIPTIIGGIGREGLFSDFVKSINKYNLAFIPGSGAIRLSMVHVDDLVNLLLIIVKGRFLGDYNAANDAITVNDWVDVISEKLGKNPKYFHIPFGVIRFISYLTFYRLLAPEQLSMLKHDHVVSNAKSKLLGWMPERTSRLIISDITDYIISNEKLNYYKKGSN